MKKIFQKKSRKKEGFLSRIVDEKIAEKFTQKVAVIIFPDGEQERKLIPDDLARNLPEQSRVILEEFQYCFFGICFRKGFEIFEKS